MDTIAPKCVSFYKIATRAAPASVCRHAVVLLAFAMISSAAASDQLTNLLAKSFDDLLGIEVVYAPTKRVQLISEAPASVSLITQDDIRKFGYQTIADALRSVRGVYVTSDRNYSYVGIRGFARPGDYNTRVLVLVDGHRMNENIYDSAYVGAEAFVDVDMIDRIEVIRGPSSSIYGNSAFLGVVNVVTRPGRDINGVEASVQGGSFDTYKARVTGGTNFSNGIEWVVSGSVFDTSGQKKLFYKEFANTPSRGIVRNSDDENAYNLFTSVRYSDFTLSGGLAERDKHVPTASYETIFADGREKTEDLRAYCDLRFDRAIDDDSRVLARAYYDNTRYYGVYPYEGTSTRPVVLQYDKTIGDWVGSEAMLNQHCFEQHTVTAGVDVRLNVRQEQLAYYSNPRSYELNDHRQSWNLGAYVADEYEVREDLHLNVGIRYDHYSTFGGSVNPRAGIVYALSTNSAFKLLYGRAFRAPNDYELHYFPATGDLDPETIDTVEFVYDQALPFGVHGTFATYFYHVDDLISQHETSGGDFYFDNAKGADAAGIEAELERRWTNVLLRGSYALQYAEDTGTGKELSNSPRHLGKLSLSVPLWRTNIFTGVEAEFHADTLSIRGRKVPDFAIVNWTLYSQQLAPGLEISASVYNLFDVEYGYPGAVDHQQEIITQDGRSFRVKLTYLF